MINSANTVDFGLGNNSDIVEILPRETVPSDQLNAPTYAPTTPQNNTRLFLNYGAPPLMQYAHTPDMTRAVKYISKTKDIVQSQEKNNNNINNNNTNNTNNNNKERVRVQHLQTHEKLQNNRWNYHTLYNISAEMEREIPNNNNNNYKLQNESAFTEDQDPPDSASAGTEFNNNSSNSNRTQAARVISAVLRTSDSTFAGGVPNRRIVSPPIHRTEDQENAFRRIEDVHNYAKLKRYSYSNGGSSNSSIREDDDDEDDDDDDDEEDDVDEHEVEEHEELDDEAVPPHDIIGNCGGLDANYARYFSNLQSQRLAAKVQGSSKGGGGVEAPTKAAARSAVEESEADDAHVDVETVQREPYELPVAVTPAHHARRPMNAFLIFCKRHRAIVKDRYKSLENRAITKILGDWWASLDVNDKKCFTNLAQLNKDAFFSANPNFKWCKLPAPPLRTLNTRPSSVAAERAHDQEPPEEDDCPTTKLQVLRKPDKSGNYFKLADEAQMGELSSLLTQSGTADNNNKKAITSQPSALQQALGETTQFLSTHMPTLAALQADADKDIRRLGEQTTLGGKRCMHSRDNGGANNSFSSNSNSNSEDDIVPPKKTARSCKGKIYQELINSGQISAITKKSPSTSTKVAKSAQSGGLAGGAQQSDLLLDFIRRQAAAVTAATANAGAMVHPSAESASKRTASESLDDLVAFDLEERIKELPALNLDAYLQRKRSTKKKKKFTAKKRNSNSASSSKSYHAASTTTITAATAVVAAAKTASSPTIMPPLPREMCREPPAVGSQKRKARKESITRRDVNAIENEVAAALLSATDFTTVNGCYFFNETPVTPSVVRTIATTITTASPPPATASVVGHASPHALATHTAHNATTVAATSFDRRISSVALSNFSENISSTSDLLILAEVAANRTELTN